MLRISKMREHTETKSMTGVSNRLDSKKLQQSSAAILTKVDSDFVTAELQKYKTIND